MSCLSDAEAVNEYGAQVYNATIIYNFGSLVATSTGSALNNIVVDSNYGATPYGVGSVGGMDNAGGSGVRGRTFSGSIDILQGQQWYDMYDPATSNSTVSTLVDDDGNFVATSGSITITKIYHEAPAAINRYFDPYAGTGTGIQSLMQSFGFGNYSPGVNFMLMPMFFDALKISVKKEVKLPDISPASVCTFPILFPRFFAKKTANGIINIAKQASFQF